MTQRPESPRRNSWRWFHRLGSPPGFWHFSERLAPWLLWPALALLAFAWWQGLFVVPPDYQQGDSFRLIYVHVPAAWLSLFGYVAMAAAGLVALVWRMKLAECMVLACAPVGASFTALALASGMLWGRPTWGTYWIWDARLTSELVLLFLYLGVIALDAAMADRRSGARAASLLAVVGVINVPIVHYSVEWWNSLHQGPSVSRFGRPAIAPEMLWPLLQAALACNLLFVWAVLRRCQALVLLRASRSRWVRELVESGGQR